ncbi:AMP-binding protein [Phenylobacterium sp. LjRoot219]|uniref:AMP-binding protein n=1 Tax=Phenylobacterium sp. LjRoot219 TaxID=3342283 RepID=UPI003ECDBC1C
MGWSLRTDPSGFAIRWSEEVAAQYRAAGHWRETTLVDAARAALREDPNRLLLIEGEQRVTRAEVWDQALRLAAFFASRGLTPGDVVAFQLPNWVETAVIALAARMAGLVINPIPPIYRESELGYILKDCGAKLIFVPQVFRKHDHLAMLQGLRAELPALADVVVVRGDAGGGLSFANALAFAPAAESALPKVDPAAVMMVMYTSGTTGRPKGVLHTHYSFDYRVRGMGEAWAIGPEDVVFMPSPVTHITGAFWAFDMPWVRGSASVLVDIWSPDEAVGLIQRQGCTVSGGATPFLQQLLNLGKAQPEALASLRLFFCGGTTVSPDLVRAASEAFPNGLFFRAYGSTEHTTATTGIRSRAQAQMGAETDGEIVPPTEIRIVDPVTGAPVADGEEGEIVGRGPELFFGYLHPEDNEPSFDAEGFFRSGDLGRRVHGNYLVITGRKKDIIIRSGENISPKEVEDVLFNHPAVAETAIVAMPSPVTGEAGCAFVIARPGATIDLAEMRRFLTEAGLAKQKFPERLVVVDDLPRVPSGKVRKDELRRMARDLAEKELS